METLARRWCAEHEQRHAHATCMACGNNLCQECTTQWEGINHCRHCIDALGRKKQDGPQRLTVVVLLALAALLAFALVRVTAGLGAALARVF